MPTRKKFRVRRGNSHLTVYPWTHPTSGKELWRYAWREAVGKPWRYVTKAKKADIEASAHEKLEQLEKGGLVWSGLGGDAQRFLEAVHLQTTSADWPAVLDFLKARKRSSDIVGAVARFMDWKTEAAGEETPHLARVRGVLEEMSTAFTGRDVAEIHAPDLLEWWRGRGEQLSPKRRKDIRSALVTFWSWARREGIAGADPITPAERLPSIQVDHGERRVLSIEEMERLFAAVEPKFRVWAVLGAFAGLRPEEIAPPTKASSKKKRKRGLHIEEIDWTFSVIRVPAVVSKVNTPRVVPFNDALRAGLAWACIEPGMTGPVCLLNPVEEGETLRLGKVVFKTGWPQDALRHSYGSYRNAVVRSLPKVAEEMGTSVTMLNRHYHNPKAEEEGRQWFALRPKCSDFVPMKRGSKAGKSVEATG